MKKIILSFLLCAFCTINTFAQDNITDVIYLTDGNSIRGIIIEYIPGNIVKLKANDGNVLVYSFEEISKITREIENKSHKLNNNNNNNKTGYKGFVDFGYSLNIRGDKYKDTDHIDFTTSHGYQFNPYFFLGIGVGVNYYYDTALSYRKPGFEEEKNSEWLYSAFINPRATFLDGSISPFIDAKAGYSLNEEVNGFYLSPSAGLHLAIPNSYISVNVSAGYTLQTLKTTKSTSFNPYKDTPLGGLTFKVGIDF